jgi:20S proteasome alpha/beta subunit
MTALVGVLCSDGVVIGTDSAASFAAGQTFTIKQKVQKAFVISDGNVIVAGTGQVGMGQRFNEVVQKTFTNGKCKTKRPLDVARELSAEARKDFHSTMAHENQFGALVGFASLKTPQLCEFATRDFQPELKDSKMWFVSMGSGQPITDPFLGLIKKAFFRDAQPTLAEGIFTVNWALQNVIDLCVGHIDGPAQIAVLHPKDSAGNFAVRILTDDEVAEHNDNAKGAEKHLGLYRQQLGTTGPSPAIPEVPEKLNDAKSPNK